MASVIESTAAVRRFNRTWTQRTGVLDESFLGLGLPLGAARLVYEVGEAGAGVGELRERLDLDSGYLSRLLRTLEERGLARVTPDPTDGRRRTAALTEPGRALLERLEERSEDLAARLVAPLTDRQRQRLTEALATADLLVRAATVTLREVDPGSAAARDAMALYFDEIDQRFPDGFDPGEPTPPDSFTLATSDGATAACGGVQRIGEGIGEVKRMWVAPGWRGAGLGARLLRHLEAVAAAAGHHVVRLDTNGTLTEAIAMYERAGYRPIERYNDNPYAELFFEKALTATAPGSTGPSR